MKTEIGPALSCTGRMDRQPRSTAQWEQKNDDGDVGSPRVNDSMRTPDWTDSTIRTSRRWMLLKARQTFGDTWGPTGVAIVSHDPLPSRLALFSFSFWLSWSLFSSFFFFFLFFFLLLFIIIIIFSPSSLSAIAPCQGLRRDDPAPSRPPQGPRGDLGRPAVKRQHLGRGHGQADQPPAAHPGLVPLAPAHHRLALSRRSVAQTM